MRALDVSAAIFSSSYRIVEQHILAFLETEPLATDKSSGKRTGLPSIHTSFILLSSLVSVSTCPVLLMGRFDLRN